MTDRQVSPPTRPAGRDGFYPRRVGRWTVTAALLALTACRDGCRSSPQGQDSNVQPPDSGETASPETGDSTTSHPAAGALILRSNSGGGCLDLIDYDSGVTLESLCLGDIIPESCHGLGDDGLARCQAFGVLYDLTPQRERLLLVYARQQAGATEHLPGGVLSLPLSNPLQPEWQLMEMAFPKGHALQQHCENLNEELDDGLPFDWLNKEHKQCFNAFPHDIALMPDGETIVLTDTSQGRVIWARPPVGDAAAEIIALFDQDLSLWNDSRAVNCLQLVQDQGHTLMLLSYKAASDEESGENDGRITMWDVTDPQLPSLLWAWPTDGVVAAVHNPALWETDQGLLMSYAHSLGASDGENEWAGSMGLAQYSYEGIPEYLADIVLAGGNDGEDMGFVRDVQIVPGLDKALILDSGCSDPNLASCTLPARMIEVALDIPSPPSLGGGWDPSHDQQSFQPARVIREFNTDNLYYPFDIDLIQAEDQGQGLRSLVGWDPN